MGFVLSARVVLGCFGLLALSLTVGPALAQEPLSLESAVRLALTQNERALKAPLRVQAAQGQLERSRAAFLPSLSAGGSGVLASSLDRAGRSYTGSGTLTLSQPLLNLAAVPLYSQARHQLASERHAAVEDRRQLAFDTARAFLVVLTTQRVLEAASHRLERARANQENAEARAKAQLASSNDVTRALLETAAAAREVAQGQGSVSRAYLALGFLIGQPIDGPLATPDRTTHAAKTEGFSNEDLVRLAESQRPDLQAAKERTLALQAGAKEPLYRIAPQLGAAGQVRLSSAAASGEPVHDESLQLTLSWALYDGGARYGDRRTRLAQADSQALDERLLRRSIATDLGLALASLQAARESDRIAEAAVAAAQRNTAEAEILYRQGLARAIEVVDANARRFDAEVSRATAKLAMEQAYLELRYVLGLGPVDEPASPSPGGGAR